MSKHTPGPWEVVYMNRDLPPHVMAKLRYKPVDVMIGGKPLRISNCEDGDANARLIAAAPELLEALKEARKCLRKCHYVGPEREVIDAAIAKAEGR